ncbi:MAG: FixH family protein [Ktedonobacteraceae bacterium]|nr:FixH family protein [Ktedonobacteraceae bacterium]
MRTIRPITLLSKIGRLILLSIGMGFLLIACGTTGGSSTQAGSTPTTGFHTSAKTSDGMFLLQFSVTPNTFGTNAFTVSVEDATSKKPVADLTVQLTTTMLDMNMGTDSISLQSKGDGQYSTQGQLSMGGNWEIGMHIRTPDKTLHEAKVKLYTPG